MQRLMSGANWPAGVFLAMAAVVAVSSLGCGPARPSYPAAKLAGNVRIDGEPIATGRIHFMPNAGTTGAPVTGEITAGRYSAADVPLGSVTVTFSAAKETGKIIREGDREPYAETASIIPAKYQEGLPLDVTGDSDAQDFDLTTK